MSAVAAVPSARPSVRPLVSALAAPVIGAALCLGVAWVHVKDQGGLTQMTDPAWKGVGYWALEVVAVLTAVALLVPATRRAAWLVSLGVALGPAVGYVLSRTTGLPGDTDDIGEWDETIGIASLVVEGLLLALAVTQVVRARRTLTA